MWIASKSDRLRGLTKNLSEFAREVVTQEAFGWVPVSGAIIFLERRTENGKTPCFNVSFLVSFELSLLAAGLHHDAEDIQHIGIHS